MMGRRADARLVRDAPAVRRFMPLLSPRRNESVVYFAQDVEVETALRFLEAHNATRPPDAPLTLFHLVLNALAAVFHEHPRLNRFTAGGRLWQRDGVWITLSAKQRLDDDAPIMTVKRRFEAGESLDELADGLHTELRAERGGRRSASAREIELLLALPPALGRRLVGLARLADELGLMPRSILDADPMHASAFVANLGSVGLEAGYHHLWEFGNIPVFGVLGRIKPGPGDRRMVTLKWTFDERVEDGLYAAHGLELIRERLASPEKL